MEGRERGVSAARDASSLATVGAKAREKNFIPDAGVALDGDALASKLPGRLPICDGPTGNRRRSSRRGSWPGSPWNSRKITVGFMAFRYEAASAGGT